MPTYEYKCKKCGNTFEKFQSITANPIEKCKKCDGEVYRLISKNVNFILKGKGYYSTDNRKSSYQSEKKRSDTSSIKGQEKKEISKKSDSTTKEKKDKDTSVK